MELGGLDIQLDFDNVKDYQLPATKIDAVTINLTYTEYRTLMDALTHSLYGIKVYKQRTKYRQLINDIFRQAKKQVNEDGTPIYRH